MSALKRLVEISLLLIALVYVPGWIYRYSYFSYFGIQTVVHEFPPEAFLIGTLQLACESIVHFFDTNYFRWNFCIFLLLFSYTFLIPKYILPKLTSKFSLLRPLVNWINGDSAKAVLLIISSLFFFEYLIFSKWGISAAEREAGLESTLPSITIISSGEYNSSLPNVCTERQSEKKQPLDNEKERRKSWCAGKLCSLQDNLKEKFTCNSSNCTCEKQSSDLRLLLRHNSKLYIVIPQIKRGEQSQKTYIMESNEDNHNDLFIIEKNLVK